jgi:mannose-6-phosphate isomerase-like protein (cupin superfamily)
MNIVKAALRTQMMRRHTATWPLLQGLSREDLEQVLHPGDDPSWRVRDLLAHLAAYEQDLLDQARRIVAGKPGTTGDFSPHRSNQATLRRMVEVPAETSLRRLRRSYRQLLAFLNAATEEELQARGPSSLGANTAVESLLQHALTHRASRVEEIQRALGRPAPPDPPLIHDLVLQRLHAEAEGDSWRLTGPRDVDHLLASFGYAQYVRLDPGAQTDLAPQEKQDEVWILLEGKALFTWLDLRERSPTYQVRVERNVEEPVAGLVPLGVAFGARALGGSARLLRLASRPYEREDQVDSLSWERSP